MNLEVLKRTVAKQYIDAKTSNPGMSLHQFAENINMRPVSILLWAKRYFPVEFWKIEHPGEELPCAPRLKI